MVKRLETLANSGIKLALEDIERFVPESGHEYLRVLHERMSSVRETAYLVLVSQLYDPQEQALELMVKHVPETGRTMRFTNEFYQGLLFAHEKREAHGVAHNPEFLLAEIDTSEKYRGFEGKVGPGPHHTPRAAGRARKH